MNTRLEQDAQEAFAAFEAQQAFRDLERLRWQKAQPVRIVGTWAPVLSEQEKREHDARLIEHRLPF